MSELIKKKSIFYHLYDYFRICCGQAAGSLIDRAFLSRKLGSRQLMMAETRSVPLPPSTCSGQPSADEPVLITNRSSVIWPADVLLLLLPSGDEDSGSISTSSNNHTCSRLINSFRCLYRGYRPGPLKAPEGSAAGARAAAHLWP